MKKINKNILNKTAEEFDKFLSENIQKRFHCLIDSERIKKFIHQAQINAIKETVNIYEHELKKLLMKKNV